MKKILFFIFSIFISLQFVFAQSEAKNCGIVFSSDLKLGDKGEEVLYLQKILNTDERTKIAKSGVGSPGEENNNFGKLTEAALLKFQNLFIDYIEFADGITGERTRDLLNKICESVRFENNQPKIIPKTQNNFIPAQKVVEENKDKIAPKISLSLGETALFNKPFRVFLQGSEAIKSPNLSSLIIEGGVTSDLRKMSSSTYSFLITPNDDNYGEIYVQVEADTVEDLSGNKNEDASNELKIVLTGEKKRVESKTSENNFPSEIKRLLDNMLGGINKPATATPFTPPQPQQNNNQEKKEQGFGELFGSMLKSLFGGGGGSQQTQQNNKPDDTKGGGNGGGDKTGGGNTGGDKTGGDKNNIPDPSKDKTKDISDNILSLKTKEGEGQTENDCSCSVIVGEDGKDPECPTDRTNTNDNYLYGDENRDGGKKDFIIKFPKGILPSFVVMDQCTLFKPGEVKKEGKIYCGGLKSDCSNKNKCKENVQKIKNMGQDFDFYGFTGDKVTFGKCNSKKVNKI